MTTYLIFEFLDGFSDGLVLVRVEVIVLYEQSGYHSARTFLLHTQRKSESESESDGEKRV